MKLTFFLQIFENKNLEMEKIVDIIVSFHAYAANSSYITVMKCIFLDLALRLYDCDTTVTATIEI